MGNSCCRPSRVQLREESFKDSVLLGDGHPHLLSHYEPVSKSALLVTSEKPIPDWTRVEWIRRKADRKKLVLKRVEKARLPTARYYVFPCSADSVCECQRCKARRSGVPLPEGTDSGRESQLWSADPHLRGPPQALAKVTPLELVLLQTNNDADSLPEFVESIETDKYFYYITKSHGIKLRKVSRISTWFRPKYHPVNWTEYTRS